MSAQISYKSYSDAHQVNLWLYALANRIAEVLPSQSISLNNLLADSEEIMERISPSAWNGFAISRLSNYAQHDPKTICSHHLHQIIQTAINGS